MGFFDDESRMYIPMTIDTTDVKRSNYFLSNKKVVEMIAALLPYIFMLYPMMQGGVRWLPILIVSAGYALVYVYFIRFRILEEIRLRNMVRELDENRISGVDHFWGINKIGNKGSDDGIIHYKRMGSTERGLVVYFDRGSTVGVEEGNYTRFRQTKMDFLREISLQKFNFQWYEIPKRSETPEALIEYFNKMTEMDNDVFRKLLKLQIDINIIYTTDTEQRYVDYIVIRNKNFRTLRRFRKVVQEIIDSTLETNGYIIDAKILGKKEVEKFFEDVLQIDSLDSGSVRKGTDVVPFENFATVQRVIRQDGRDLPLEFLDMYDLQDYSRGATLESLMDRDVKELARKEKEIDRRREVEMDKIRLQRNKDKITSFEYHNLQEEINRRFDEELELLISGAVEEIEDKVIGKGNVEEDNEEISVEDNVQVNIGERLMEQFEEREKEEVSSEGMSLEELMELDKQKNGKGDED